MIWRVTLGVLAFILVVVVGVILYAGGRKFWQGFTGPPAPVAVSSTSVLPPAPAIAAAPAATSLAPSDLSAELADAPAPVESGPCAPAPAYADAAARNAASLTTAAWSVFGRPETGWEVYAPLVAREIGTACAPDQPGFAKALADWRARTGGPSDGVMTADGLKALNILWLRRRPFVAAYAKGACPPGPAPAQLASAAADEGYQTKPNQLRATALTA